MKQMYQRSSGTFATPTQSLRLRNSQSAGGNAAFSHSSRPRSSVSGAGELSNPSKKRHADEPTRSIDHSAQDSGRGLSAVTSSGSLEHSQEKKSKKKNKKWG
ncbi:unnamed protein product [Ilex paraguariensis]|uniref:Uncharacterized protein n=1 Tax=Ilex paraguariensis TaxID=185542 RepID=A0ABC8UCV7_9AQUA